MVARAQIAEVYDVIARWVEDSGTRAAILTDLTCTVAYQKNKSFKDTVDRLIEEHASRRAEREG